MANFEINPTTRTRLLPGDDLETCQPLSRFEECETNLRRDVVCCEVSENSLLSFDLKVKIKLDDIIECFGTP